MSEVRNVFEAILKYGHDEDFAPIEGDEFEATNAPAGSDEKIAILRRRVEQLTYLSSQTTKPLFTNMNRGFLLTLPKNVTTPVSYIHHIFEFELSHQSRHLPMF